jgi:uncharacterized protein YacL
MQVPLSQACDSAGLTVKNYRDKISLHVQVHKTSGTLTIERITMSADFIARLIGMVVFAILGTFWGSQLGAISEANPLPVQLTPEQYSFLIGLVGALFGLILTPFFTTRPIRAIRKNLTRVSAQSLSAAVIGLVSGLIIAALLSIPLSRLPFPFGDILPFISAVVFAYLGVSVMVMRKDDVFSVIGSLGRAGSHPESMAGWSQSRSILLDTSVIIDGRILDVARTGFIPGTFIIPHFILAELQYIADSPDNLRRQRGRRGLEVLTQMQKDSSLPVKLSDQDVEGTKDADEKLVMLAKQMHCPILTNDYNLNRVAELQGVTILNINELANSVKSILLPGETLSVHVIQEGKDRTQGVGYMDDGTMVVVENGKECIGKEVMVSVTKVLQTTAGRMIFARPVEQPKPEKKESKKG